MYSGRRTSRTSACSLLKAFYLMETSLKHHGSSGSGGGDSAGAAHETAVSGAEPRGFPFIQPQLCAAICVRRGKDLVRGLTSLCLLVSCRLPATHSMFRECIVQSLSFCELEQCKRTELFCTSLQHLSSVLLHPECCFCMAT